MQLGFLLVYAEKFGDVIFISFIIKHYNYFAETLQQHYRQEQYSYETLQLNPDGTKVSLAVIYEKI